MNRTSGIYLVLLAVIFMSPACQTLPENAGPSADASGIRGVITLESSGEPIQGSHVYAYMDYSKNLVGVADHVSKSSNRDGSYQLMLPPGEYYLVARKRVSGANYGPIVTGDLYDHSFQERAFKVLPGKILEKNFLLKELSEPMFFQVFTEGQRKTATGIRGRILNEDGEPVQGAFATAYRDSNMKRLPDFASTLTGDDGGFTLYLPEGGKWYVGARSHARGAPVQGEPVGRYDGSSDHSLKVSEGSFVEGVEITLKPFSSQVPEGYSPY